MLQLILHIFLWILAILGILLGLLLLMVVLVLFVPVRYQGRAEFDSGIPDLQAGASWLLHLIRVKVSYEKQLSIRAYILFFKIFDSAKPEKEKSAGTKRAGTGGSDQLFPADPEKEKTAKTEKTEETAKIEETEKIEETAKIEETEKIEDIGKIEETTKTDDAAKIKDTQKAEEAQKAEAAKEKEEVKNRKKGNPLSKLIEKVRAFFSKLKGMFLKVRDFFRNIRSYIDLFQKEETHLLSARCKDRIFAVLRSIRPRKLEASLVVGTGSPDTTGYCLAVAGMFYPVFGKNVHIEGDFENTVLKGHVKLKGKIRLIVLVARALQLYFDKELRKFIHTLKREDV